MRPVNIESNVCKKSEDEREINRRKSHTRELKFKVAIEALRGDLTVFQLVSKYAVSQSLVFKWKKQLLEKGSQVFQSRQNEQKNDVKQLHEEIGRLTLEKDFLEQALYKNQ